MMPLLHVSFLEEKKELLKLYHDVHCFWRCLDCEISHQQKLQVALA